MVVYMVDMVDKILIKKIHKWSTNCEHFGGFSTSMPTLQKCKNFGWPQSELQLAKSMAETIRSLAVIQYQWTPIMGMEKYRNPLVSNLMFHPFSHSFVHFPIFSGAFWSFRFLLCRSAAGPHSSRGFLRCNPWPSRYWGNSAWWPS